MSSSTLLENVKGGSVTNAAKFFQVHAPRTLRTTEILLDDQGVAVSFRAPMAVQDETGKSMLEEKQAKLRPARRPQTKRAPFPDSGGARFFSR